MEGEEEANINRAKLRKHPKERSNFLSDLLFCWELPLVFKSWKNKAADDCLFEPLAEYESKRLGDKLEQLWQEEENFSKNPSLTRALIKLVGCQFCLYGIILFPFELSTIILQPLLLKKVLDFHTPNQTEIVLHDAYFYASILCVVTLLRIVLAHWITMQLTILGIKIRIACSSLIYRRCLKLKQSALDKVTVGHMVNLLSNDVNKFDNTLSHLNYVWIAPINLVMGICFLDFTLGHAAVSGVLVLIIFFILQVWTTKKFATGRRNVAEKTDHRIRLMNDVICGIQAIKLYTWEKPYLQLIESARSEELKRVTQNNQTRVLSGCFSMYASQLCVFLSVLVSVVIGLPLSAQYVFVMYNIYDNLKIPVTRAFPFSIIILAEARVSIKRIEKYLLHSRQNSEKLRNVIQLLNVSLLKAQHDTNGVHIKNISVKWDVSAPKFALNDVNFKALPGELVGVVGAAGSGKSTLLHVILREIDQTKGEITCGANLSYASQEPWIFSGSIKQNILFGQEFDQKKYENVINVCALRQDLFLLPHGDQTRVGERGVMLSGGQKARIGLARAIYRDADVYLLDDPLSAVDAHVAQHIFKECICDYLKPKCVVLVTHQIQFLKNVDRIYLLEAGRITDCDVKSIDDHVNDNSANTETEDSVCLKKHDLQSEVKEHSGSELFNKNLYVSYFSASNSCLLICLVFGMCCCSRIISILIDVFITLWTNLENDFVNILNSLSVKNLLEAYSILTIFLVLTTHIAVYFFLVLCKKASRNLHNNMLYKTINAPLAFFHQHSSGRILNRFTNDTAAVDETIPYNMVVLVDGLRIVSIVATIIYCNYWLCFPAILLLAATSSYKRIFHSTMTNIKRAEATTRSAVFSHLSMSVQGLTTIRSFKVQDKIIDEFDTHQDLNSSAVCLFREIFFAFGFWTDITCALFNCLVIFSFFLRKSETGVVGLAITQSSSLLIMLQFLLKYWSELEAKMISVERMVEYAKLDPEPDDGVIKAPKNWPMDGNISFICVSLSYTSKESVLKDISFKIRSGEKIGIVGRTGAGKTSLISVLFRLFNFNGAVVIDGINTKSVPLISLRSKISIIPQEPVLFLGTLRKNLDPFNNYTDEELWKCLEEIQMKDLISNLPSGLQSLVSEKGSNFSVGERQLFCLGRAMLTKNKIVVLDEATANVDLKTDELIQSTIREKFKDCTVLIIAHRLNTVIDADKILVMDDGNVVEFDHPFRLLQNIEGFFYGYVKKNGSELMTKFLEIAKNDFERRYLYH